MDKREFLKASGLLVTGSLLSGIGASEDHPAPRTNWSGNYVYRAAELESPQTLADLRESVRRHKAVKALGSRHSFNSIADTRGDQVSLRHLDGMTLDEKAQTVTAGAGLTYGALAPWLDARGYALHNLASLPHITVAGACATATHGSGNHNGNLATAVRGLEMVTADGDLLQVSRDQHPDLFPAAVVSLGGLGIVTRTTLAVQPTYQVAQTVYENLPFAELEHHLEEIFASGYSVSLFTDWQHSRATQAWVKRRVQPGTRLDFPAEFFGATKATRKLHPIAGHPAESCTEQMGIPGPWYERLPHFRMNFTPSSGNELQTEYIVPREHGYAAIRAVEPLRDRITPLLYVTELRTIAADDLWMSPMFERESLAIHFTWKPEWTGVRELLPHIEASLAPFAARPHWAKVFTVPQPALQALYPRMTAFRAALEKHDPSGKFRNEFLDRHLWRA
jgi:xylitol oxidase